MEGYVQDSKEYVRKCITAFPLGAKLNVVIIKETRNSWRDMDHLNDLSRLHGFEYILRTLTLYHNAYLFADDAIQGTNPNTSPSRLGTWDGRHGQGGVTFLFNRG